LPTVSYDAASPVLKGHLHLIARRRPNVIPNHLGLTSGLKRSGVQQTHSAALAVSHVFFPHGCSDIVSAIRDDVMGQLFLDVEEGRVALTDIKRFAKQYVSDIYGEEARRISLDAPAFSDGTGGSKLDKLSEADGIWA
jgi:hypothetical protein